MQSQLIMQRNQLNMQDQKQEQDQVEQIARKCAGLSARIGIPDAHRSASAGLYCNGAAGLLQSRLVQLQLARYFDMKICDNFEQELINLNRPSGCLLAPCIPCRPVQAMEVSAPPGNVIGSIAHDWFICSPSFLIQNYIGDTILRVECNYRSVFKCGDVEFNVIHALNGQKVGKIYKRRPGLAITEMFTKADFFCLTFPMDLDVRMKAVLIGVTILIDSMSFEKY
ncbi:GH22506 [Drosophila grimshawi]|uniref:Phospholipid scramblase n=2 Tax=Drosophila grimshawi TaxID=7222 RepID=B4JSJ1_DROGR|nr:GH22506 [Drosophila grimshawi]